MSSAAMRFTAKNIARPDQKQSIYIYIEQFFHQKGFAPKSFYTRGLLHQKPFVPGSRLHHQYFSTKNKSLYTTTCFYTRIPETKAFYTKNISQTLYHKPLYTRNISHQTPFLRHGHYARSHSHQTPFTKDAFCTTSSSTAEWSKSLLHQKPYNAKRNRNMAHTLQPWRKQTDPRPTVGRTTMAPCSNATMWCSIHIKNTLILRMSMQNAWKVHSGARTIRPNRISCKTSIEIEAGQFKSSARATSNNIPMSRILPCNSKQHSGFTKYCAFMKSETPPSPFFVSDFSFLWLSSCDFVCDSFLSVTCYSSFQIVKILKSL